MLRLFPAVPTSCFLISLVIVLLQPKFHEEKFPNNFTGNISQFEEIAYWEADDTFKFLSISSCVPLTSHW